VQGGVKREEAGLITKKLQDCRMELRKENVYACLLAFRSVLEKMVTTRMLPADKKMLQKDINTFQEEFAASRAFRSLYGPVTFKDDDLETALDFMKQLIQIKEEEIVAAMESPKNGGENAIEQDSMQQRIDRIMVFAERGDVDSARKMAQKDEEAADALIEMYNTMGIQFRVEEDFEKSVTTFKKAILVHPDDEGLYYNMARAHIESGDWKSAKSAMEEALKINHEFQEGERLLAHINKNMQQGLPTG
jgi:tetratricopeptide (TPR) repeat protein